jgi:hypothetical protein
MYTSQLSPDGGAFSIRALLGIGIKYPATDSQAAPPARGGAP